MYMTITGNSDPGTSGCLTPFIDMDNLYFDANDEPSNTLYDIVNDMRDKYDKEGSTYIMCECDNPKDFYDIMKKISDFNDENVSVLCTSRENKYDIVIHDTHDMDDTTGPSTVKLQKKKIDDVSEIVRAEEFRERLNEIEAEEAKNNQSSDESVI